MRKTLVLSLVLTAFLALVMSPLPIFAQEKKEMTNEAPSMMPPKPLDDDFHKWMIGEWEGWSTSPMGKSQDWQKFEWGLDNQFVVVHYTAKPTETNAEAMKAMAEAMKMSKEDMEKMAKTVYKGMGTMTVNPTTGELVGYWFDNMRGTYKGTGKREGNKATFTWEGTMGTRDEVIEKVGEDKMVMTFKETSPNGDVSEGRTELTRKKMTGKS
jgi:hypothetical protein